MDPSLVVWLKSTAVSRAMIEYQWLWPICETLHFIGLTLLIGAAGVFDLRLMGLLRQIPVVAAMQLRGWAAAGFVINVITGILFFVGAPDQYVNNPAWRAKLLFLVVALVNVAWFETMHSRRRLALAPSDPPPASFRVAGAVSMGSWLLVLYFGRMLPFIGSAF